MLMFFWGVGLPRQGRVKDAGQFLMIQEQLKPTAGCDDALTCFFNH